MSSLSIKKIYKIAQNFFVTKATDLKTNFRKDIFMIKNSLFVCIYDLSELTVA